MLFFATLVICLLSSNEVFSQDLPYDCGHPSFDCVPHYLCVDGVINDSGIGVIDIRLGPSGECYLADDPGTAGLCCRLPEKPDPVPIGKECFGSQRCLPFDECVAPNTDGEGIIDIRGIPLETCWAIDGRVGVCCDPPVPPTITCPHDSFCVAKEDCLGQAYDTFEQIFSYNPHANNEWALCENPLYGICCIPPPPVDRCPGKTFCVDNCNGNAYDPYEALVPYDFQSESWLQCKLDSSFTGVCCDIPPIIDHCPSDSSCVGQFECLGEALEAVESTYLPFTANGALWSKCYHQDYHNGGICCRYKEPLKECPYSPHGSRCVPSNWCYGNGYNTNNEWKPYGNSGNIWEQCYISEYENGVCCEPPYTYGDCPLETACVPTDKCDKGKAMDYTETFYPYQAVGSSHNWASCFIRERNEDGICCEPHVDIPPAGECGVRNSELNLRITGGSPEAGKEAKFGELPWQAIIFTSNYTFVCGATILSNNYVITGAHCVDKYAPYQIKIRFGEWQVNSFEEPQPYVDIDVRHIIKHESFNPKNLHNDIAVLELDLPITFQYHISPICLPPQGYVFPEGQRCITSGWGKDSFDYGNYQHILKLIDVPLVSKPHCQQLLRKTKLTRHFRLDKSFMCAGGELNIDACKGDGGGPLVCQNADYTWSLVGITAWGIGCGQQDIPGVYVDVAHFIDWIDRKTLYSGANKPVYGG